MVLQMCFNFKMYLSLAVIVCRNLRMCPVFLVLGKMILQVCLNFNMYLRLVVKVCRHLVICPWCLVWGKMVLQVCVQLQNVSQSGSQSVQTPPNVPSVYSVGKNGSASVSQTGSQSVQTPHNLPVCMVWGKITLQMQFNLKVFFNFNCLRLPVIMCPVCLVWGKICVICSKFNMINMVRIPLAL